MGSKIQNIYALSPMQNGMLYHYLADRSSPFYFQQIQISVRAAIDNDLFQQTVDQLVERHDVFRTVFVYDRSRTPAQVVLRKRKCPVYYEDISSMEEAGKQDYLQSLKENDLNRGFDLEKGMLTRVYLIMTGDAAFDIIWSFHHIILDGWSLPIIIDEFIRIYRAIKHRTEPDLEEVIQYSRYIKWLENQDTALSTDYWKKYLAGWSQKSVFPGKRKTVSGEYRRCVFSFTPAHGMTEGLKKTAAASKTTLNHVLNCIWGILLQKYNNTDDALFGVVTSGRSADIDGIDRIAGLLINTVPMRIKTGDHATFQNLLESTRNDLNINSSLGYIGLARIQNCAEFREGLFDNIIAFENYPLEKTGKDSFEILAITSREQTNYDLTVTISIHDELCIRFTYNLNAYEQPFIKRLTDHIEHIISQVLLNESILINEIELLPESEKKSILDRMHCKRAVYPADRTIHTLFEAQAAKFPGNTALVSEEALLTYSELNRKANRLARVLRKKGLKPNNLAALLTERSPEMITGILSILKAGGAYLPIDPQYPAERIAYMLENSRAEFLLTTHNLLKKINFNGIIIDLEDTQWDTEDDSNPENRNTPSDLAYVIYTSGTTGRPKGVMIEHKNVVQLLFSDEMPFRFNEKDVWTMFHSYCFDFSVWEMYGALLYGGKLVLISRESAIDTDEYLKILKKEKVTVLNQIPTPFYNLMTRELRISNRELQLRYVIFGGEALKPEMLKPWITKYPDTRLVNMYGITETTVHVTYKEIGEREINGKVSNIGRPLPAYSVCILDRNLKLLPPGVPGELCVGGAGVGRGYLNNNELTSKKFISSPYQSGDRLYRSGDLARQLDNGDLEYLGRIDQQVKIRGYRIEPGEIESRLLACGGVKEAAVAVRENTESSRQLCAYFTADMSLTANELREYLARVLPQYMIPSCFIQVEKMPLTSNGKLDRKALQANEANINTGIEYIPPVNAEEETLASIWADVLSVKKEKISTKENFFATGGDSIRAISLISLINKALNVQLQIRDLYAHPDIESLGKYIKSLQRTTTSTELIEARQELEAFKQKILQNETLAEKLPPDIEDLYPMSSIEQGMVYHSLREHEKAVYHDQFIYPLNFENFDINLFKQAMTLLVFRHTVFRTSFDLENFDVPVQIVHKQAKLDIEQIDMLPLSGTEQARNINAFLENDRKRLFNFSDILWRIRIFRLSNENLCLAFIFHHAILDGWSAASFITELMDVYFRLKADENFRPGQLKHSYKDFIADQMTVKNNREIIHYWKRELSGYRRLNLHFSNSGEPDRDFRINKKVYPLSSELLHDIRETAKSQRASVRTVCFTAYLYMLNMISYDNDILAGLVENNRPVCEDGDKILGCFLNTVPFRMDFGRKMTWKEMVTVVEEKTTDMKFYGRLPLFEIIRTLDGNRNKEKSLFDTLFNYVDFHIYNNIVNNNDVRVEITADRDRIAVNGYAIADTLLDVSVNNTFDQLEITVNCSEAVFTAEQVDQIMDYFVNVLEMIIHCPDRYAEKADILNPADKDRLIFEFNNTIMPHPPGTIHELFEEQVKLNPHNTAVVHGGRTLTYDILNKKANQLARLLVRKGIKPGAAAGILLERSIETVIAILAVLKAGGAYLPLDPDNPGKRTEYILEDSAAEFLLSTGRFDSHINFRKERIDPLDSSIYAGNDDNPGLAVSAGNPAYIIYTSGSTGKPKGVMIEHGSVVNLRLFFSQCLGITAGDRILQFNNAAFDVSVMEIFQALLTGAALYIVSRDIINHYDKFGEYINRNSINIITLPPAYLEYLDYEKLNPFKIIITGGAKLNPDVMRKWSNKAQYINEYGPTEAAILATYWKYDRNTAPPADIPIGKPIPNTKIYILDKTGGLQPPGMAGEICIAGACLARGYVNNPGLSGDKFVDNPLFPGERIYKTGDIGKWLPDGNIGFMGRIDYQVKIRGFRVEPEEIENALSSHKSVKEAVVIDREDNNGSRYLCAYMTVHEKTDPGELRQYLSGKLPDYMIPSFFVIIGKMPLTPNGKIDRKSLPAPGPGRPDSAGYEAPRNPQEKKLAEIWCTLLGLDKVGINDDFFTLGGHSLKAIVLAGRIHREWNVEISLTQLFDTPTIKEICGYLSTAETCQYKEISRAGEKTCYMTSSSQKRIYTLQNLDLKSVVYNMPYALLVEGKFDRIKAEKTFNRLIQRHEALRTSFEKMEKKIVQKIHADLTIDLLYMEETGEAVKECVRKFIKPFNLSSLPLIRAGLIKLEADRHILLMDMHHIISDGVSMEIFCREFRDIYSGKEPEKPVLQYKDFAEWQNRISESGQINLQEQYWLDRFSGKLPVLNLITDYNRPAVKGFAGDSLRFQFEEDLVHALRKLAAETGTTMYMVLLSGINVLLAKYSGQDDIIIGSTTAGRHHPNLETIMGMFVNTLVMRNHPETGKCYEAFLHEVKDCALQAFRNQDYQFEVLVEKLSLQRDTGRNPLFDVMFTMQNVTGMLSQETEPVFRPYNHEHKVAKFDLTFSAVESGKELFLEIEYSTLLFREETVRKMGERFMEILEQVTANRRITLGEITVYSKLIRADTGIVTRDDSDFEF